MTLHPAANSFKWRISLTEAGLATGAFYNYGLPAPDVGDPRDHSQLTSQGDGGQSEHGYERFEILFARLSEAQMTELGYLVRTARLGTKILFMTVWSGVGYDLNPPRWLDVSGKPHRPEGIAPAQEVGIRGQLWYEPVRFLLNNMTVLNDPSLYTT